MRSYISYLASGVEPEKTTMSVKGAWIAQLVCDLARVLHRDSEPLIGPREGPFSAHVGARSEGQILGSKKRRLDPDVRPERRGDDAAQDSDSPVETTTARGQRRERREKRRAEIQAVAPPQAQRERELSAQRRLLLMVVSMGCSET